MNVWKTWQLWPTILYLLAYDIFGRIYRIAFDPDGLCVWLDCYGLHLHKDSFDPHKILSNT